MNFRNFSMKVSSSACNYFLTLPEKSKVQFLRENTVPIMSSCVSETDSINSGGAVCMLCLARSLETKSPVFHNP